MSNPTPECLLWRKENLYLHEHQSISVHNLKLETLDEQIIMEYSYHEIPYSTKKGYTIDTHNNMDGFQEHYSEE